MKIFSIIVTIVLAIIFVVSLRNTYMASKFNVINHINENVEAFDPASLQVDGFVKTESRISTLIVTTRNKEDRLKMWIFILNLFVTVATGITALITTISTKKSQALTLKATVYIAVIAFVSTILNFAQGQVNTLKENAATKIITVKKIRDEMEALKPQELPVQLLTINRELDDL